MVQVSFFLPVVCVFLSYLQVLEYPLKGQYRIRWTDEKVVMCLSTVTDFTWCVQSRKVATSLHPPRKYHTGSPQWQSGPGKCCCYRDKALVSSERHRSTSRSALCLPSQHWEKGRKKILEKKILVGEQQHKQPSPHLHLLVKKAMTGKAGSWESVKTFWRKRFGLQLCCRLGRHIITSLPGFILRQKKKC